VSHSYGVCPVAAARQIAIERMPEIVAIRLSA